MVTRREERSANSGWRARERMTALRGSAGCEAEIGGSEPNPHPGTARCARRRARIRPAWARGRPVGRTTLERGAGTRHRWRTWPFPFLAAVAINDTFAQPPSDPPPAHARADLRRPRAWAPRGRGQLAGARGRRAAVLGGAVGGRARRGAHAARPVPAADHRAYLRGADGFGVRGLRGGVGARVCAGRGRARRFAAGKWGGAGQAPVPASGVCLPRQTLAP
jgi:hypothetical protein